MITTTTRSKASGMGKKEKKMYYSMSLIQTKVGAGKDTKSQMKKMHW